MWRPFLMSAAMAVPTVVHLCPNLFWYLEVIVFAGVMVFWSPFSLFFTNKLTIYSIIADKGVI